MGKELKCEVCKNEPAVGVCCVPGVAYSAAYGKECLEADAHPWDILVANTVCVGGLEQSADWWKKMVENTCKHLKRTIEEFNLAVAEGVQTLEQYDGYDDDDRTS